MGESEWSSSRLGSWLEWVYPEAGKWGPDGAIDTLGSMIGFVRGHELHMLALLPRSRLEIPRYLGSGDFADRATMAVAMSLPSGDSLVLHFGVQDTLPVGLVVTWTDPYVEVTFSDWDHSDDHRLFRTALFRQGEEEFQYVFESLRLGPLPDSVFEPVVLGGEAPDA